MEAKINRGKNDASSRGTERRRYFRTQDHVVLKYRTLAPGERDGLLASLRDAQPTRHFLASSFANTSQQMRHVLHRIQESEPDIAHYLESLNDKLDLLSRHLSMEASGLADEPTRKADISAAGVCFEAHEPVTPERVLEIRMLLLPSKVFVLGIGRVVRCDEVDPEVEGLRYRIGVDFDFLRDEDRELLVQHVIKKETGRLRETRGKVPPAG